MWYKYSDLVIFLHVLQPDETLEQGRNALRWLNTFFYIVSFIPSVFTLLCVFCYSLEFYNWTFNLEQPDGCAAASFGKPLS